MTAPLLIWLDPTLFMNTRVKVLRVQCRMDNDCSEDEQEITFYQWMNVNNKKFKWQSTLKIFTSKIKESKYHIFVKDEQYRFFEKRDIVEFEILVICDFSENYENKNQDEMQSAYFGHSSLSLLLFKVEKS